MHRICLSIGVLLPLCCGCGSGERSFAVARTEGVVLCDGKPVEKAQVYFEPMVTGRSAKVGKQGFAFSGAKGEFRMSTYGNSDGAVIGKHRVRVGGDSSVKCDCETNSERTITEVEIVAGKANTFELKLPAKVAKKRSTRPVITGIAADDADAKMDNP